MTMAETEIVEKAESAKESVWTGRFIAAAMAQGFIAVIAVGAALIATLFGAELGLQSPSKIIAGGGVGTWVLVGFFGHIVVGVVGVAVTGLFYHHVEIHRGTRMVGLNKLLAWVHLLFLNIGAAVAPALLIMAGYAGGAHMLTSKTPAPAVFGEVHQIVVGYVVPIGAFMALGAIGVLAGGLAFARTWFSKGVEVPEKKKLPAAA